MISLINVSEKSIILDLAAGSGDLANLIKKSKCQCILYDANTKMLEKAKKKLIMESLYQEKPKIYLLRVIHLIIFLLVLDLEISLI